MGYMYLSPPPSLPEGHLEPRPHLVQTCLLGYAVPVNRQTDMTENITFLQITYAGGNE